MKLWQSVLALLLGLALGTAMAAQSNAHAMSSNDDLHFLDEIVYSDSDFEVNPRVYNGPGSIQGIRFASSFGLNLGDLAGMMRVNERLPHLVVEDQGSRVNLDDLPEIESASGWDFGLQLEVERFWLSYGFEQVEFRSSRANQAIHAFGTDLDTNAEVRSGVSLSAHRLDLGMYVLGADPEHHEHFSFGIGVMIESSSLETSLAASELGSNAPLAHEGKTSFGSIGAGIKLGYHPSPELELRLELRLSLLDLSTAGATSDQSDASLFEMNLAGQWRAFSFLYLGASLGLRKRSYQTEGDRALDQRYPLSFELDQQSIHFGISFTLSY